MASQTTFVTTLGGKPEIITMQVDMLLARGFPIDQVLVILLSANLRCQEAYQRLQAEFAGNRYQGKPIGLQAIPLRVGDRSLGQVSEPAHVEAVRRTFNELLADLKQKNQTIHLGATAGRRIMALVGLAAAMQYLEPTDHVWHMHTPDEVKVKIAEGGLMHVPTDWGVQLVEVPFVPWAAYFPGLAPLLKRNSSEMLSARFGWLDDDDRRRCAAVWEALTPRQRVVLGCLAEGLERKDMAEKLSVAVSTIDSHREAVQACCEEVWSADSQEFSSRYWADKFGPYLRERDQQ